jgi:predicted ester cyclase
VTTDGTMSRIETNKAIIDRYFEAYNTKNCEIFDEIIAPEYVDHGQSAYMGSPGKGVAGAKRDLKYSLDKLDDLNYVVEAMIASEAYPDLVGAYWKGSLIPKAIYSDTKQTTNRTISYRGVSIYRIQNGKIIETWHVFDGLPLKLLSA